MLMTVDSCLEMAEPTAPINMCTGTHSQDMRDRNILRRLGRLECSKDPLGGDEAVDEGGEEE